MPKRRLRTIYRMNKRKFLSLAKLATEPELYVVKPVFSTLTSGVRLRSKVPCWPCGVFTVDNTMIEYTKSHEAGMEALVLYERMLEGYLKRKARKEEKQRVRS